jgi:lysine 2,3-aminomutase
MRVDDELIEIMKDFKEKASALGISQFIVQTHYQTPLEMTVESKEAIRKIISAGWIVTNQSVYNVASSRRGHNISLRKTLINNGVVPYYTFTVKGFRENYAVYAPVSRSVQEKHEEKIYGAINYGQQNEFIDLLKNNTPYTKELNCFLQKTNRPFISSDRSVLNLPGIGKSMTFFLTGITSEGKRVLCFDHDNTRKHSPTIKDFDHVFITENKSIFAYLKQLDEMGEDIKGYHSIWGYTKGQTEPKFMLYEYPEYSFAQTKEMNHISVD